MTPLKEREFTVSPETENSHWLKGDESVITLTTADHNWFVYRILLEIFPHVSSLKDEQKEVVVHLLRSKDVVTILPTGFGKILIHQPLRNGKRNANAANAVVLIVLPLTQKDHERTNRRDGRECDSFHRFVNKGRHASAD